MKRLVLLLAILAATGCSALGIGAAPDPLYQKNSEAWDTVAATHPDDATAQVGKEIGDALETKYGTEPDFPGTLSAIGNRAIDTGNPYLVLAGTGLTAAASIFAWLKSNKTAKELNDPVAGARRQFRRKEAAAAVAAGTIPPAAPVA